MKFTPLMSLGQVLVALSLLIGISPAFASSVNFTDGSWNGAHNQSSFTTHASGIDLFATGGLLSVNFVGGPSGDNTGNDGLGIGDDEITQGGRERLRLAFAAPVTLNTIKITDLFLQEGPTGQPEVGKYSLNGGAFTAFTSVGGSNGALTLNIFTPGITSIVFKSSNDYWSDYSVKGLTYSVPEPSSLLLLGSAMTFLALTRRRASRPN
jgi:hypothetical protein